MTNTNTVRPTRRYVANRLGRAHYVDVAIRRVLAADLQVGDILSLGNGRFVVTAPVRPGFAGRGVRITTAPLSALGREDHTWTDPGIYFLHVED